MKFSFPVIVGHRTIQIEDEAETMEQVWAILAAWDGLPKTGPNGETDLEFCFRTPKNKAGVECKYYSIICRKAKQELRFGILQGNKGLFPKGWEPLQRDLNHYEEESAEADQEEKNQTAGQARSAAPPPPEPPPAPKPPAAPSEPPAEQTNGAVQSAIKQEIVMPDNSAPVMRRARFYLDSDMIEWEARARRYKVGVDERYSSVERGENNQILCVGADGQPCKELAEALKEKPPSYCAHIWAVKLFTLAAQQSQKAA